MPKQVYPPLPGQGLDRAEAVAAELRELVREAHGATKDLTRVLKEAREFLADEIYERVASVLGAQVKEGLDAYRRALDKAIKGGEQAMMDRQDRMISALFGDGTDKPMEQIMREFRDRQSKLEADLRTAAARGWTPGA